VVSLDSQSGRGSGEQLMRAANAFQSYGSARGGGKAWHTGRGGWIGDEWITALDDAGVAISTRANCPAIRSGLYVEGVCNCLGQRNQIDTHRKSDASLRAADSAHKAVIYVVPEVGVEPTRF
jgi:hypothetical protein